MDEITIEAWDQNKLRSDKIIGSVVLRVSELGEEQMGKQWHRLMYAKKKGKEPKFAGELQLLLKREELPKPDDAAEGTDPKPTSTEPEDSTPSAADPKAPPKPFKIRTPEDWLKLGVNLHILQARQLKNVQRFGAQDPYCKVKVGESKEERTEVHDDGGTSPKWENALVPIYSPIKAEQRGAKREQSWDVVSVQVWDKEVFSDDFIAEITFGPGQIQEVVGTGPAWYPLTDSKGKPGGEIELAFELGEAASEELVKASHARVRPRSSIGRQSRRQQAERDTHESDDGSMEREAKSEEASQDNDRPDEDDEADEDEPFFGSIGALPGRPSIVPVRLEQRVVDPLDVQVCKMVWDLDPSNYDEHSEYARYSTQMRVVEDARHQRTYLANALTDATELLSRLQAATSLKKRTMDMSAVSFDAAADVQRLHKDSLGFTEEGQWWKSQVRHVAREDGTIWRP